MAFVARTTRESNRVGFAPQNTPNHVGPGSYKPPTAFKRANPAFAPFSSTSHRVSAGEGTTTTVTPGPGAYVGPTAPPDVRGRAVVETPFMSFSDRFKAPPTSLNPGPGQYVTPGAFDRALTAGKKAKRAAAAADPAPAVTWVRVATAPSIPAPAQSYGYEEGRYGELTMQKAPDKGHTGRGYDTAGPGEYAPDDTKVAYRTSKSADFSRSRSQRTDFAKSAVPGPGAYYDPRMGAIGQPAPGTGGSGKAGIRRPPRRTAAFASRVPRSGPKGTADSLASNPGPGQYKPPTAFKRHEVPARQQFFGSTSRRFDDPGARSRGTALAPGPGAYMSSTSPAYAGAGAAGAGAGAGAHVGFASTSSRFGPGRSVNHKDTPGVGAYTSSGLAEEVHRKVTSGARNGVFGSTVKRFYTPPSNMPVPGPGAYDKDPKMSKRTADMARKPQSMFASKDTRFKATAPPGAPDPGTYDVAKAWSKPTFARGPGILASGPERFGAGGVLSKDQAANPGPGQYDVASAEAAAAAERAANRRGVFVSGANRFQPTVPDAIPGPGSYDTDYVYSSLHKRTYNMSIAEQEAGW